MRPWQFSKPKTPGFGISRGFYLSALLSKAVLPSIFEVVNPKGEEGAVVGYGVPMGTNDREALRQPLTRGVYAVAAKDRKTVLRLMVVSKEEAGFDPESFAVSATAQTLDPELLARVRATWTIGQLTFESHDPMVYAALDFVLSIAQRLAMLSEGAVADPISQRYLLPHEVFHTDRVDSRVDARDHVSIQRQARSDGIHVFTLGLQKLALPEMEIAGLFEVDEELASRFLLVASQSILAGNLAKPGDRIGTFQVAEGGFDKALWEGVAVYKLLPPTSQTAGEALRQWSSQAR